MQSRPGVGTQASALRYHVEMGEIPTWNCLPVPWELAGAPLLRGRGLKTQKSSTLWGGGLETPLQPPSQPLSPFPICSRLPREPRTHHLERVSVGVWAAGRGVWVLKQDTRMPLPLASLSLSIPSPAKSLQDVSSPQSRRRPLAPELQPECGLCALKSWKEDLKPCHFKA